MTLSRRELCLAPLWLCTALPVAGSPSALPSLAKAYAGKLLFGSAITPEQIVNTAPEFIAHHFNVVVAENAMKPESLAGEREGLYNFAAADALVDWAQARGIAVRGHTLLWHRQMPGWFLKDGARPVSAAQLTARIERYVTDVVTHFKGRVFAWDVVNEAYSFGDASTETDDQGMRLSELRKVLGPDFMDIAFRAAAKADPAALLFYNDYETQDPRKVQALSQWVSAARARGVKIDGIGHQAHCSAGHPSVREFARAIDAYAELGLTQHVTELDIALNEQLMDNKVLAATPALLQRQAQRYGELMTMFLRKRDKVSAVLVWGIGDAYTWLTEWPMKRFEAPLLFDTQLQAKPAFRAVIAAAGRGQQ